MNEKMIKILIPILAVVVIIESLVLVSKLTAKPVLETTTANTSQISKIRPVSFKWGLNMDTIKTGITTNIPLSIMSVDKKVGVDAVDLYINYDPNIAEVVDVAIGKDWPAPSFKKINKERGLVVLNFLIDNVGGYVLDKNVENMLVNLKVNFKKEGTLDFSLSEASLVVENTSAKVLPFNSEKLVINVTR